MRNNPEWTFGVTELEKGELWSGYVKNVVDGDTVDVRFNIYGVQRVRLVGINTPEIGEDGYEEANEFDSRAWKEDYTDSPSPMPTTTPIPGFELLFAMIGVVAAMCLIKQRG